MQKTNEMKKTIKPIIEGIAANKIVKLYPISENRFGEPDTNKSVSFSVITEKMDEKLYNEFASVRCRDSETLFELANAGISYLVARTKEGVKMCLSGKKEVIGPIHAHFEELQKIQ